MTVEGLKAGQRIRLYDTVGRQYTTRVAANARETLRAVPGHITIVEVTDTNGEILKTAKVR